jgi:hypothetical protein
MVLELAPLGGQGDDREGYRTEFLKLASRAAAELQAPRQAKVTP